MLAINMDDVINVLTSIRTQLIVIGVALAIALVVIIAAKKIAKPLRGLVRGQACVAWLLVVLIMANNICNGPMRTMLDLISETSYLQDETTEAATELVSEITEEGVVLAKNEGSILPIASGSKLNVFGWASTNPCYGGTGSGALNTAYPTVDILQGLNEAGIETNEELSQFYRDYQAERPTVGMWAQDWTIPEPAASAYTQELIDNAKAYSDTAMIVITRVGGEGADLPSDMMAVVDGSWSKQTQNTYYAGTYNEDMNEGPDWDEGDHFLQLTNQEEQMVDLVCENFDNVVVVYNGANAFELGWVNDHPQIKGVLLCPGTGQSGFRGFGRVVSGAVNPSGKTVDTYVYDLTATQWWNNFGCFVYDNMDEFNVVSVPFGSSEETVDPVTFVDYVEDIYVGYKFYETAADEGLIDYDKTVLYPFGYGLSYTSFDHSMSDIKENGGNLELTVTVKNTGTVAGKDVVEVYYDPPYTNGGIEKATAASADFSMDAEHKADFYNISNYLTPEATAKDEEKNGISNDPVTTADAGHGASSIQLKDLRGLEYDDPKWDELLDQMSLDDYNALISLGGYQTNGVSTIGKIRTNDNDGPASINNNFTGVGSVGFPAAVLIASTWNDDLAYKFGDSIGTMGNEMNTSGWYGPAMNIHRTAFAGRNFEYYSEDGVLSGSMAANAIKGAGGVISGFFKQQKVQKKANSME